MALGGALGLAIGVVLGFAAALAVASLGPPRLDGTYGLREMLVCLPLGAVTGLAAGLLLAR